MKRIFGIVSSALGFLLASVALADSPGPSLNPYRAYPPSCLAVPLPTAPSGPSWSTQVTLPQVELASGNVDTTETVTITFWRSPCSAGQSALLGLLQRSAQNEGSAAFEPIFPGFYITQGSTVGQIARVAAEPNTVVSDLPAVLPTQYSTSFVVENFADPSATLIDFTQAMTVTIAPSTTQLQQANVSIPAYDSSQYTDASPLPITGYLTGNWFDPAHGGEGVQIEVGEVAGTSTRYVVFAWYTFDSTGTPYWLFGSGNFTAGDRSATVQLAYSSGGGFAGDFVPPVNSQLWGTVTVSFPDCNTMDFSYASTSGLPSGVPTGSGNKEWTRLTVINGATCQ